MSFSIDMTRITGPFGRLRGGVADVVSKTLDDAADVLLEDIRKNAPKDSGRYAKSWKKGRKTENTIELVTPQGRLFIILEFEGRRPGRIDRIRAEALHFEVSGEEIFARHVDHPGFPPIPHVRPALNRLKPRIIDIFFANLTEAYPWLRA